MDDIYDNLENYNEVNALEELRSENKELKVKLEEYATSMDKLQKDFDKLNSEFKRLANNYSSVVKTAKSEIERKTQIINNINMEKDMLILKAFQNGNRGILRLKDNIALDKSKSLKDNKSNIELSRKKFNTYAEYQKEKRNSEIERIDRKVESYRDRSDRVNFDSEHKSSYEKSKSLTDINPNQGETEENVLQNDTDNICVDSNAVRINNRRKSVQSNSMQELKFTSEDETNDFPAPINDCPLKDNVDKHVPDTHFNQKYESKLTECTNDGRRFGNIEYSRDSYRDRYTKHHSYEKYRYRDKYENLQSYRRHSSPDRFKRRPRHYQIEYSQRSNYGRGRILESPPRTTYSYSRKQYTHQSNHDSYQHYEQDKHGHQDGHSIKYKRLSDNEEPLSKRKRLSSYNKHEDINHCETAILEEQRIPETVEQLKSPYTSCQSPEHTNIDVSTPIKEIKNIAVMQLEDPRISSEKYCLDNRSTETLISTTSVKNTDFQIIRRSSWGIKEFPRPKALCKPLETQIKLIYTDIEDGSAVNITMESDEIPQDLDHFENEKESSSELKEQTKHMDYTNSTLVHNEDKSSQAQKFSHDIHISRTTHDKSLEPTNITEHETNNFNNLEKMYHGIDYYKETEDNKSPASTNGSDHNNLRSGENLDNNDSFNVYQDFEEQSYLPSGVVVDDLELSDETSDNTDYQVTKLKRSPNCTINKDANSKKLNIQQKMEQNVSESNNIETNLVTINNDKDNKEEEIGMEKSNIETNVITTSHKKVEKPLEKKEELVAEKRNKGKKKTKNPTEECLKEDKRDGKIKKDKKKKGNENPVRVKTKLQNLFGENCCNSLITPDDLGITSEHEQNKNNYMQFSEDAQAAITPSKKDNGIINTDPENSIDISIENDKVSVNINGKNLPDDATKCSLIYKNLEPLSNETDIVKTVIISTGNQPEDKNDENSPKPSVDNDTIYDNIVEALATSTPYKSTVQTTCEMNNENSEVKNNSNECQSETKVNSDNLDCQNTVDVPDVRIFIRRKKKVIRRPLET